MLKSSPRFYTTHHKPNSLRNYLLIPKTYICTLLMLVMNANYSLLYPTLNNHHVLLIPLIGHCSHMLNFHHYRSLHNFRTSPSHARIVAIVFKIIFFCPVSSYAPITYNLKFFKKNDFKINLKTLIYLIYKNIFWENDVSHKFY